MKSFFHKVILVTLAIVQVVLFSATIASFATPKTALAAIQNTLGYQGRLKNSSGDPLTGSYNFTFRLYTSQTGGAPVWTETQNGVTVDTGFFAVQLSSVTPFPTSVDFNHPTFITTEVNGDGEMTPRVPINSVPSAYTAGGVQSTSTAPNASGGRMYYDLTNGNLNYYDAIAAQWKTLGVSASSTDLQSVAAAGNTTSFALQFGGGTSTKDFAVLGNLTVASSTSLQGLTATNAAFTALTGTNATFTSLSVSNFNPASINTTDLTWVNATGTNTTSTNLFATSLKAVSSTIATLNIGSGNASNLTVANNFTVSGAATLQGLSATTATFNGVTSTALAFTSASGSQLFASSIAVNGSNVCLADGTNCPSIGASTATLQQITNNGASTTNIIYALGGIQTFNLTATGSLVVSGASNLQNVTLTDATTTALFSSNLKASSSTIATLNAGSLNANSFTTANASITGGSINGTQIGNITPSTAVFTSATATSVTSTNLFATSFQAASGTIGTLNVGSGNVATLTVGSNFTVAGATSLQGLSASTATFNEVTSTALAFTSASGSQIFASSIQVNGSNVCLANGTNCPAGNATPTLQQVLIASNTSTIPVYLLGGITTLSLTATGTLSVAGVSTLGALTFTNGTATNVTTTALFASSFQATSATIAILAAGSFNTAQLTVGGDSVLNNLTFVNGTATNVTTTNLFFANASGSNIFASSIAVNGSNVCLQNGINCPGSGASTATLQQITNNGASTTNIIYALGGIQTLNLTATGTLNVSGASTLGSLTFTAGTATNVTTTAIFATSFKTTSGTAATFNIGNGTIANLIWSNATGTNTTSTALFATSFKSTSGTIATLNGGTVNANSFTTANASITGGSINGTQIGNITPSTGIFTNVTGTSVTSTNFFATNGSFTNLSISSLTVPSLAWTNATGTSLSVSGSVSTTQLSATSFSVLVPSSTNMMTAALARVGYGSFGTIGSPLVQFGGTTDTSLNVNIRNGASTTNASSDYIATADVGDDSSYFVTVGINSSNYANPDSLAGALDSYIYANSANLVIGTATASSAIIFHTSGTTFEDERMRITSDGYVGIGTTSPSSTLDVIGDIRLTGMLTAGTVTSTFLYVSSSTRLSSDTRINGTSICLVDGTNCPSIATGTSTLQSIATNGNTTTQTLVLYGGFLASSSTVTSTFTVLGQSNLQALNGTNATFTNVTTTNLFATNAQFTNLSITGTAPSNFTNLTWTNATGTNTTSTAFFATSLMATSGTIATANHTTLNVSGSSNLQTLTVGGNFTVAGAASLQGLSATTATFNGVTSTALAFTSASGSQIFASSIQVNGSNVCLSNGANCPAGNATPTLAQVLTAGNTSTVPIYLLGGITTLNLTATGTLNVSGQTTLGALTFTNSTATNVTTTALNAGSITVTSGTAGTWNVGVGNISNLVWTNATGTNTTSTALFSTSFQATSATIATLNMGTANAATLTVGSNFTVAGATSLQGLSATTATFNGVTSTALAFTSASGSQIFASSIQVNGSNVCLSNGTNCPAGNATPTLQQVLIASNTSTIPVYLLGGITTYGLTATGALVVGGDSSLQNVTLANATATNVTTTALFSSSFQATSATIVTLNAGTFNANSFSTANASITGGSINGTQIGNVTPSTAVFTNATATSFTTTNLFATNAQFTNLSITGTAPSSFTNLTWTNATGTNTTSTALFATSFMATSGTIATANHTTLNVSGASNLQTLTVGGNFTVAGATSLQGLSATTATFNGVTSTALAFTSASGSQIFASSIAVNGSNVCLANGTNCPGSGASTATLQQITNNGASTTNIIYALGGIQTLNLTATGTLNVSGASTLGALTFTDGMATNVTTTALNAGSITVTSGTAGTWNVGVGNINSLVWTNATGTNTTSTALFATSFQATSGTIATLNAGALNANSFTTGNISVTGGSINGTQIGNITPSTAVFTNATATSVTSTNLFATNAQFANLSITGTAPSSFTNLIWTNATGTNTTSTALFATSFIATSGTIATLNMGTANAATLTVGSNFTVAGATSLQGLSASTATFNGVTSTALAFTSASGSQIFASSIAVNGSNVCLANGTNCPGSSASTATLQQITNNGASTTNIIYALGGIQTLNLTATGTLNVSGASTLGALTFTNGTATNVTTTALNAGSITVTSGTASVWNVGAGNISNLVWTNATGTNATSTALFATSFQATSATIATLNAGNLNANSFTTGNASITGGSINGTQIGNITPSTAVFTNATATSVTTTNLFATNAQFTNLSITGTAPSSFTNLTWTNATGTNTTSTALFATSIMATSGTIATLNMGTANAATLTVGSNFTVSGAASLQGLSATTATFNGVTSTALAFTSASGSQVFASSIAVNGSNVCLQNGINCPGSSASTATLQQITNNGASTTNIIYALGGIQTLNLTATGTLNVSGASTLGALTFTNGTATNVTTTALNAGSITVTSGTAGTWNVGVGNIGSLVWTNATGTNTTSTALFATSFQATSATIATLNAGALNANSFSTGNITITDGSINGTQIGNITPSTAVFTNATATSVTTTNLFATNAQFTNLSITGANLQNLTWTNATGTNTTSTALFATSFQATTATIATLNMGAANAATLTVGNNFTVAGATSLQGLTATTATFNGVTSTALAFTNASGSQLSAVSIITGSLTVNGSTVCLTNGTNCPSIGGGGSSPLTDNAASNIVYLTTSTRDFLLGSSATSSAGFIFDSSDSGTSTVFIGPVTRTNLIVGALTYDGGLAQPFGLDGNDVYVSGSIGASGGLYTTNLSAINASATNVTTTAFAFTSASGSQIFASSIAVNGSNVCLQNGTNCPGSAVSTSTLQQITNNGASTTNIIYALGGIQTLNLTATGTLNVSGQTTLGALTFTNGTATNVTSTALFATSFQATSATIATLNAGTFNANSFATNNVTITGGSINGTQIGNLTPSTAVFMNATATSVTTTNLFATNAQFTNLSITGTAPSSFTSLTWTNATGTNTTSTAFFATSLMATSGTIATANHTTLNVSGASNLQTLTVGGNFTVAGATSLQGLSATTATFNGVTSTALAFTSASGSQIFASSIAVNGSNVCLANGTNCPGSGASTATLQQITNNGASTTNIIYALGGIQTLNLTATGTLNVSGASTLGTLTFTNGTATNVTTTALNAGSITVTSGTAGTWNVGNGNISNLTWTNATGTNTTSTALFATSFQATSATIATLNAGALNANSFTTNNASISGGSINGTQIGNITPATAIFTNATATSVTSTNLFATNAQFTNLSITGANLQNMTWTNATGTNTTSTALFATSFIATSGTIATLNMGTANAATLTVGSNFTVAGATSLQGLSASTATFNGVTSTALAFTSASGSQIFASSIAVNGSNVCLQNGTNCPGSVASTATLQQITNNGASTTNIIYALGGIQTLNLTATGTLNVSGASTLGTLTFTNGTATNVTTTALNAGSITVTSGTAGTWNVGVGNINNLVWTNATGTNTTSTALFATSFQATSATIATLNAGALNANSFTTNNVTITGGSINGTQIGNITPSTAVFTNATATSVTTTNLFATNAQFANLSITGTAPSSFSNLSWTNATGTNTTSTALFATSFMATSGTIATANHTTLNVSGASALQTLTATNATFTAVTTTAIAFASASGSQIFASSIQVNGANVCLSNGTNCPGSSASTATLQQITNNGASTTNIIYALGGIQTLNLTATGTLNVSGVSTLGALTFTNGTATNVTTTALFAPSFQATSATVATLNAGTFNANSFATANISITGGSINGTQIGNIAPSTAVFTNVTGTNVTTTALFATSFMATSGTIATANHTTLNVAGSSNLQTVAIGSNLTVSGATSLQGLSATTATFNGVTSTALAFTSASGSQIFASSIAVNGSNVCLANGTNCPGSSASTATLQQITNNGASTTNIIYALGGIQTLNLTATGTLNVSGASTLGALTFTNGTATNVTTTALFATSFQATSATIATLNAGTFNANSFITGNITITGGSINGTQIGNVTPSTAVFTNATATSVTTTNLFATNAQFTNLSITGTAPSNFTNLTWTNATGTNTTSTAFFATSLMATSGTIATANHTTLNVSGSSNLQTLTVGGNFTVAGATSLQGLSATTATFNGVTSTALAFTSASGSQIFASSIAVNGSNVCLANGTNCPAGSATTSIWQENGVSNIVYLTTSTRDLLIGGSTTATAGLIFDSGATGTSNIIIGGSTNTNLLVGALTYAGGLDSTFSVNGNDVFVQGMLGTLGGLVFSNATGVNAVITNATATSLSATSFKVTSSTIATLNAGALVWANATGTNATATALFVTSFQATSGTATTWNAGTFNSGNAIIAGGSINGTTIGATTPSTGVFTNVTSTNSTSTALFATNFRATSGTMATLNLTTLNVSDVTTFNALTATNATLTNVTTTAFSFNNASGASLTVGGQNVCLADGTNCSGPNIKTASGTTQITLTTGDKELLVVTTTPSATTSQMWITANVQSIADNATTKSYTAKITRGTDCSSTQIGTVVVGTSTSQDQTVTLPISIVDSPSTTSPVTYHLCAKTSAGAPSAYYRFLTVQEVKFGADLGEVYYSSDSSLSPGEVVTLDPTKADGVLRTTIPYDPNAIGVVSTYAGQLLSQPSLSGGTPIIIGLVGRVPVRASNENGAINSGDPLTSASTSGYVMKATGPGAVLGRAMQPLLPTTATTTGLINMFVQPGNFLASVNGSVNDGNSTYGNRYMGIGTLNPQQKLEVTGNIFSNTSGTSLFITSRGSTSNYAGFQTQTAGNLTWTVGTRNGQGEDFSIFDDTASAYRIYVKQTDGSVGLGGTTNPSSTLDVIGNGRFTGSVTTTNLYASSISVGGVAVCLSNGSNCPAAGGTATTTIWQQNGTLNTVYLTTSTRDLLIGGSTTATAGLIFDSGPTGTSKVIIGGSTNTNLLVGTLVYSGGLDSTFSMNGNDAFVQGMLGTLGGLVYSNATGVNEVVTNATATSLSATSFKATSSTLATLNTAALMWMNATGTNVTSTRLYSTLGTFQSVSSTYVTTSYMFVNNLLRVGTLQPALLQNSTNTLAQLGGTTNTYLQVNIQNGSSGGSASSDYVATSDDGNDSNWYIDMGINSSGYNNSAFSISGPHDGYLYTQGGNLTIGTASASTDIVFHAGGTTAADEKMRIGADGFVGIGTDAPQQKLEVAGNIFSNTAGTSLLITSRGTTANYAGFQMMTNSVADWTMGTRANNNGFSIFDDVQGQNRFYIATTTGNVGIGTITPGTALSVNGTVSSTGLLVNGIAVCLADGTNCNVGGNTHSSSSNAITAFGGVNAKTSLISVTTTPASVNSEVWVTASFVATTTAATARNIGLSIWRGPNHTCAETQVGATNTVPISATTRDAVEVTASFIDSPATTAATGYTVCGASDVTTGGYVFRSITTQEVNIGADLAEVYYSKDAELVPGDVVSLDARGAGQVISSGVAYDSHVLGVISTRPGLVMSDAHGEGEPVMVALAGRIPVKVTTSSGNIVPGDYLAASDIPGFAMKATKAGMVIGQALSSYDGQGLNKVMMFMKNTYYLGPDVPVNGMGDASGTQSTSGTIALQSADGVQQPTVDPTSVLDVPKALVVHDQALFEGDVYVTKHFYQGQDAAGHAKILPGSTSVRVAFKDRYVYAPVVSITPQVEIKSAYWVDHVDESGFTVNISTKDTERDITFSWAVTAVQEPELYVSDGTHGPVKTEDIWRAQPGDVPQQATSTAPVASSTEPEPQPAPSTPAPADAGSSPPVASSTAPVPTPAPAPAPAEPPAASSTPPSEPAPTPAPAPAPTPEPQPTPAPAPTTTPAEQPAP